MSIISVSDNMLLGAVGNIAFLTKKLYRFLTIPCYKYGNCMCIKYNYVLVPHEQIFDVMSHETLYWLILWVCKNKYVKLRVRRYDNNPKRLAIVHMTH